MTEIAWYLLAGSLLLLTALIASLVKRLPLTMSILYLGTGIILGPLGLGLVHLDPQRQAVLLERLAELAVIISLFTTGLKLRVPLRDPRWWVPVRLASVSMVITVGLIALAGFYLLHLPLGVAVLLGGILAPTDPVLAADVQLEHAYDRDRVRFSLTGEAGFNDGTAFSFVLLGLGLSEGGSHFHWGHWLLADLLWKTLGGLALGGFLGALTARLFIYLRSTHHEAVGRDDFLALGLIALSYGLGLLCNVYAFLSVFAAGLALRAVERGYTGQEPPDDVHTAEAAIDPAKAPAHMTLAMLTWNEQVEKIMEVLLVLSVGILLSRQDLWRVEFWFIPLLLVVIRPISVYLGLLGTRSGTTQRSLMAWFGIRGVGSIYYLMYAQGHGLPPQHAHTLIALTLTTIAVSTVVHGVSVTPLMSWYNSRREKRRPQLNAAEREVE